MEDVNGFDVLKNRWFQTNGFLLLGHSSQLMEDLGDLIDQLIDL